MAALRMVPANNREDETMALRMTTGWKRQLSALLAVTLAAGSFSGIAGPQQASAEPSVPSLFQDAAYWLKADAGVVQATYGTAPAQYPGVSQWESQAGTVQFSVYGGPEVKASGLNFNPVVSFDQNQGVTDAERLQYVLGDRQITHGDAYAVFKSAAAGTVIGGASTTGNYGPAALTAYGNKLFVSQDSIPAVNDGDGLYKGVPFDYTGFHLASIDIAAATDAARVDGEERTLQAGSGPLQDYPALDFTPLIGGVGQGAAPNRNWNNFVGELAEVVVFDNSRAGDRNKIESYLAIKYGLTLNDGDYTYVNSDGSSVWTTDSTYKHRITGIGADSGSGLLQKQSVSQEAGALVTIGLNSIEPSNQAQPFSPSDKSFLLFADDGGALDYNIPLSGTKKRMSRVFKIDKTNWNDAGPGIAVQVDSSAATDIVFSSSPNFDTYGFITLNQGKAVIAAEEFEDGGYFTFAVDSAPAGSPGGVDDGLHLWLRADEGINSNAENRILEWQDRSGYDRHFAPPSSDRRPIHNDTGDGLLNFNPGVNFVGSVALKNDAGILGTGTYSDVHVFTVAGVGARTNSSLFWEDTGNPVISSGDARFQVHLPWGDGVVYWDAVNATTQRVTTPASTSEVGKYNLWGFSLTPQRQSIERDGKEVAGRPMEASSFLPLIGGGKPMFLGSAYDVQGNPVNFYNGQLGEFIVYTGPLDAGKKRQIESYLAIKYGISLDNVSYLNASGSTVWAADADYNSNIAGIARDDGQGLHQKKSRGMNDGSQLTVAHGTIAAPADLTDGQFLVWGDNGKPLTSYGKTFKAEDGYRQPTERVWKVSNIGGVGAVQLSIAKSALENGLAAGDLRLLVSGDGFETFTEAAGQDVGNTFVFDTTLPNGSLFTLAKAFQGMPFIDLKEPSPKIYNKDDGAVTLAPNTEVSDGNPYSDGFLKFEIEGGSTAGESLALKQSAAIAEEAGVVSVVDGKVYLGYGEGTAPRQIGSVNSELNGAGKALQIDLSTPLNNGDFSKGTEGWTINNLKVTLPGALASKTHGNAVTSTGTAVPYTVSGTMFPGTPDAQPYSFETDIKYTIEGIQAASDTGTFTTSAAGGVLKLESKGTASAFGSMFGPEAISEPFEASQNDTLAFDWSAKGGADNYEIYGFLEQIDPATGQIIGTTELMYGRGKVKNWTTASGQIPADGTYRFRFVSGSFDQTGGRALGAALFVDNVRVFNSDVNADVVQQLARLVTYGNDPLPRPLLKPDRPVKATVGNAAGETASDNMLVRIPVPEQYATPGGIGGDTMELWLRGDKEVALVPNTNAVAGWNDQSGVNRFAVHGTPGYSAGGANFNPAVTFRNTSSHRQNPVDYLLGDETIKFKEGFAVFRHRGGALVGSSAPASGGYGVGLFAGWSNRIWVGNGQTGTYHGIALNDSSRYYLSSFDLRNSNNSEGRLDGQPYPITRNRTITGIDFVPVVGGTFGGGNNNNWSHYNGELAEVILFSDSISADEKLRVESYLALKYGMTLRNSNETTKNYVSSKSGPGDTEVQIWSLSQNGGYGHRVTGIGRDDASQLLQKQSKSQEAGALVAVAAGNTLEASNAENASEIANLRFFTFSDDNGSAQYTEAIVETETHQVLQMERTFKVQKTADWPDEAPLTLQLGVENADDLHYLVTFDGGNPQLHRLTNGQITMASGELADGALFSFAKVTKADLKSRVESAKALNPAGFTAESFAALQTAFRQAEAVLSSPTATQKQIDEALAALNAAWNGLTSGEQQVTTAIAAIHAELGNPATGEQYTTGSLAALNTAITEANQLIAGGNATPQQLGQVLAKVVSARAALVDLSALRAAKNGVEAEQLTPGDFTTASWQALEDALAHADQVLQNPNATQAEVDAATAALEAARAALVGVDKSQLRARDAAIRLENLTAAHYTPASWANLTTALELATAVLEDGNATQGEVDAALADLNAARVNLVKVGAVLTGLEVYPTAGLVPAFDPSQFLNYEGVVPNEAETINLQPTVEDGLDIRLALNGEAVANPEDWSSLPLREGPNTIVIEVENPIAGTSNVYTYTIYRATGKLVSLTPSVGSLNPAFDPALRQYSMRVARAVDRLAFTPESFDPEATIQISVNGGAFVYVANKTASSELPLNLGANETIVRVTDRLGAVTEYKVSIYRDRGSDSSGNTGGSGGSGGPGSPSPGTGPSIALSLNGSSNDFAASETREENGRRQHAVNIDAGKLDGILTEGGGHKLAVKAPDDGDVRVRGLTAESLKRLDDTGSSLEIENLLAIYPVPGKQLDYGEISASLSGADLGDIDVEVVIRRASDTAIERAQAKASAEGYEHLVDPVDLQLIFSHDGQTTESGMTNGYVLKGIALPEGIDPNRITTGVIVNEDGTVYHVPTFITRENNRYFAWINDLRSSGTYSVIWNPQDFDDVRNHWAREAVNDIAARLDLQGTGGNNYSPERAVTRSEFASIVTLGLGLMRQEVPANLFSDVPASAWEHRAVAIASEFGIVLGFEDGTFRGDLRITREQGFAMIARAFRLIDPESAAGGDDRALSVYRDADEFSSWAKESAAVLTASGIVEGKDGQLLKPQDEMTRAETAALIQRLLELTGLID